MNTWSELLEYVLPSMKQFHVDISAVIFSLGLINSRIRPQFAELGLLIFAPLIIKPAAN